MFRKCTLAAAAAMSLALAAFAPARAADLRATDLQAADQNGWRPPYHVVWGPHFYNGLPVSFGYGLCYQRRLLQTPWGLRERLVNQCW
jgi:hypothetical protein